MEPGAALKSRRRLAISILGASIALHAGLALVAGVWIVARNFKAPPPAPPALQSVTPKKSPRRERTEASQKASAEGALAKDSVTNRLQTTKTAPLSLPSLPRLPMPAVGGFEASLLNNLNADLLSGPGQGLGSGANAGGGSGIGTGMSFLGVQTNAKRVVLMFDISKTVANAANRAGMPMERIRDETGRLISELGGNTRFGIVEFARNFAFFHPELVASTPTNQKAALDWLSRYFAIDGFLPRGIPHAVTGSPGFLVALEAVFKLQPDTVFILSDGSMQRGTGVSSTIPLSELEQALSRLQASQPNRAKLFFIGIGVSAETENALRRLLASNGGTFTPLRR